LVIMYVHSSINIIYLQTGSERGTTQTPPLRNKRETGVLYGTESGRRHGRSRKRGLKRENRAGQDGKKIRP